MEGEKKIASAMKHYQAMKEAQKRYYEKKAGPQDDRRPRGRPKKEKEHWIISSEKETI